MGAVLDAFPMQAWLSIGTAILIFGFLVLYHKSVSESEKRREELLIQHLADRREDFRKEMEFAREKNEAQLEFERTRHKLEKEEEHKRWDLMLKAAEIERERKYKLFENLIDSNTASIGLLSRIESKIDSASSAVDAIQKDINDIRISIAKS